MQVPFLALFSACRLCPSAGGPAPGTAAPPGNTEILRNILRDMPEFLQCSIRRTLSPSHVSFTLSTGDQSASIKVLIHNLIFQVMFRDYSCLIPSECGILDIATRVHLTHKQPYGIYAGLNQCETSRDDHSSRHRVSRRDVSKSQETTT